MKAIPKILTWLVLLLALALSACKTVSGEQYKSHPNILFLFADDQRADTIGAWGNSYIETPHIDSLVKEGFSFRANYNLGGDSGAVCVPSRAMVNSGKAYFRVKHDLSNTKILPELLKENGYVTFATGKWHNQKSSWLRGFQRGKNIFFGGMSNHLEVPLVDLSPDGELVNERIGEKFSTELFADAAVDFLSTYKGEKPFYAYVAFTSPHDPRQPPEEYREKYYGSRPPLPANFLPYHPFDPGGWLIVRDEVLSGWPRKEEVIADQLAEYYGMVTHLDGQIGRILEALRDSGHADDTIIIFAADHGLAVGSHGLLGKQNIYEHSQKCPLIFSGPGIPRGESWAMTYLLDIFPTVVSLIGIEPPNDLDGENLAPVWQDQKASVRDSLFLGFAVEMRSVRDQRYKLIRYPKINFTQLFDLESDPIEMENLADREEHEIRVREMTSLLLDWQRKLGDDLPLSVEQPASKELDLEKLTGFDRKPDKWQPEWIVQKYFD